MAHLSEIFTGFGSVAILICIGWLFARSEVVDRKASFTVNMVVFWIAMPCMLAHTLATADATGVFGAAFAVAALSALGTAALYRIFAAPALNQRGADAYVGAMSSSYNNVANLGVPVAVAVLYDATAVVPALIFQIAFYAPVSMTILELLTSARTTGAALARRIIAAPLTNPIFLAAVAGLLINSTGVQVPALISQPVGLLGQAAVPMALLAFGMSLHGMPFMQAGSSPRRAVLVSSAAKLFVHPVLALLCGWLLGLSGTALLAVVIIAGLPTAKNVYTFSSRFGRNLEQARDSGVVTTLACLPTILLWTVVVG